MTSFYQLSKNMFKEKRKYVYLVLIVQVIAVMIFTILEFMRYLNLLIIRVLTLARI